MSSSNKNNPQPADKWQKMAEDAEKNPAGDELEPGQNSDQPLGELGLETRQQLEEQLNFMERQLNEAKNQAALAQAELANVRRRAERDVSNAHKYGVEQLINALLPVVDSLVRGLENGDQSDPKVLALHAGMQLTLDLLYKALGKFGVEIIDPALCDPFDPKLHEAVSMQPGSDCPPNTVSRVLQKGCQLHGRVLRAAVVMVAA